MEGLLKLQQQPPTQEKFKGFQSYLTKSEKNRLKSFFILLILLSFTSLSNYIKLETTDKNDMIYIILENVGRFLC